MTFLQESLYFGFVISLAAYLVGVWMKKKVLPVAANFSLNKKAKNKKRGAFFWGHLFSWGKYMVNISLEQCFF